MAELIGTLPEGELTLAERTSMPDWLEPMLARLTHDPFSDQGWIYERKLDGERALSFVSPQGGVKMMSRNRKRIDNSYPEILRALQGQSPRGCILDGEVVPSPATAPVTFRSFSLECRRTVRRKLRWRGQGLLLSIRLPLY